MENVPGYEARAAFTVNSSSVFKEDVDIVPTIVDDSLSYVPWGGDNQMPFDIIGLIEKDETLATCQLFNAEVCFGSGLQYNCDTASSAVKSAVDDFTLDNDLAAYFLGVCQDFKHFGFAVSVIILNADGNKVVRLLRKEACYCRFAPADKSGRIPSILYANGAKVYRPVPTSRSSTCSTPLRLGKICKANLPKSRSVGNSPSSAVFLRLTPLIIPFLITLSFSKISN